MRTYHIIFILLLVAMGCSRGNPVNPSSVSEQISNDSLVAVAASIKSATGIMGPYQLTLNPSDGTAELVPKRNLSIGESYIVSGESFFITKPCSDCFELTGVRYDPFEVVLNMTVTHPFEPGNPAEPPSGKNRLDLDLFDMIIAILPKSTWPAFYQLTDAEVFANAVNNADGYTTELAGVIGSDVALPYVLVIDNSEMGINTYNEFPMGAGVDTELKFNIVPGNFQEFDLYLTFGYGFSAVLEDRLNPQYYNPEYNRKSAWKVEAEAQGKWVSTDNSTPTFVNVKVYDWQAGANVDPLLQNPTDIFALSEIQEVSVEIFGMNNTLQFVTGNQFISGTGTPTDPFLYQIPIYNENSIAPGFYTGLVKVLDTRAPQSPITDRDFLIDSPDGTALNQHEIEEYATYQTFEVQVLNIVAYDPVDITPDSLSFSPVGIRVSGNYAFVTGQVFGVHVFDISDRDNPVWVCRVDTPGNPEKIHIDGNYAYVTNQTGLLIIDISNPELPEITGSINSSGSSEGVYAVGNYAYVTARYAGLDIFNVSDPTSPQLVKNVSTMGQSYGVSVSGDYAYIADYNRGLQIVDISTPSNASIIKQVDTGYDAITVVVSGDYAYVGTLGELEVFDINPPGDAVNINTVDLSLPNDMRIAGNNLFIANDVTGLTVVDISDPGNESSILSVDTPGLAFGLDGVSGYVYLVDQRKALHTIDVDPLLTSAMVDSKLNISDATDVVVSGGYAFVSDIYSGLFIVDIFPPAAARILSNLPLPGNCSDIALYDDYVYITARSVGGLHVVDISNLEQPVLVNTLNTLGDVYAIHIENSNAYIAAAADGFYVLDLTVPETPALSATTGLPGNALDVYSMGDYACVGTTVGLQIIDVSVPGVATLAGSAATGNDRGVSMTSQYAYTGDFSGSFKITDYDPPGSANVITSIGMPGTSYKSQYYDSHVFLANLQEDLVIIDVSTPSTAFVETSLELPGNASSVRIWNGAAFVACQGGGLRIVDLW